MSFDFKFFSPSWLSDGNIILFVGKRGTGKTTLLLDICYHKRRIPDGVVFSGTEESNDTFGAVVPETFVFQDWQPDLVKKVIARMRDTNRNRKRRGLPKKYSFIIVDDCAYDDSFCKDKTLRQIFMNGRHYGIFFVFTMQYSLAIHPALRNNIDWVFIMRENIPANRKRLFEAYCGQFGDLRTFNAVMDEVTDDYRCLVVRNTGTSNKVEDNIFWYRAQERNGKKWKMGSEAYWREHYASFNPHWESDENDDDDDENDPRATTFTPGRQPSNRGRARIKVKLLK